MRAVITVIGKDNVGILHKVSGVCANYKANVLEVTQSVLQDMFAMIMMVDISGMTGDFSKLSDDLNTLGYRTGGLDGIFGSATQTAVRNYQSRVGLSVDGIIGCNTWRSLQENVVGTGRTSTTID